LNPPFLILISGTPLSGKSTLAEFMYQHLSNEDEKLNKIRVLSTETLQEVMCRHISEEEARLLHTSVH